MKKGRLSSDSYMPTITIVGGGSWGTAIAQMISRNCPVTMLMRDDKLVDEINVHHTNAKYAKNVSLNSHIRAELAFHKYKMLTGIVFFVVPTKNIETVASMLHLAPKTIVVSTSKGMANQQTPSAILQKLYPSNDICVLAGPNFAQEILQNLPAVSGVAAANLMLAKKIQGLFRSTKLHIILDTDYKGIEFCGIYKNVVAIACGLCHHLGKNFCSYLIASSLWEMKKLILHFGGQAETVTKVACISDLILTCNNSQSRNFRLGEMIFNNQEQNDANFTVEGLQTVQDLFFLTNELQVQLPILNSVAAAVTKKKNVIDVINDLIAYINK